MNRQTYASDSKEKKKEYYENWKAKKLGIHLRLDNSKEKEVKE